MRGSAARNGVTLLAELLVQLQRVPAAVGLRQHAFERKYEPRGAQLL